MESAIKLLTDQAVAQGSSVATIALTLVVVYLWRELKNIRKQYDEDLVEERSRHAVEIAAERKLNADLQEARLLELRNAMEAVRKVTETVNAALSILQGRAQ
ncbi:hypothetical protein [Rhizobium phage RHph_X2_30]|nr:hypothetical protein [Rhizobium phage RHph_X2_30]